MDFKERKKLLVNRFNQVQQALFQLNKESEQIIGAVKLIEEIEKNEKEEKEKKETPKEEIKK